MSAVHYTVQLFVVCFVFCVDVPTQHTTHKQYKRVFDEQTSMFFCFPPLFILFDVA